MFIAGCRNCPTSKETGGPGLRRGSIFVLVRRLCLPLGYVPRIVVGGRDYDVGAARGDGRAACGRGRVEQVYLMRRELDALQGGARLLGDAGAQVGNVGRVAAIDCSPLNKSKSGP